MSDTLVKEVIGMLLTRKGGISLDTDYKCFVKIMLPGGDVAIEVVGDGQDFCFRSGIGFVALPNFFFVLSNLYKRELNAARLDCHGNFDYYNFSGDGNELNIEHISHYTEQSSYEYNFNLKQYMIAVDQGFYAYLQQLNREGILPLTSNDLSHPLNENVIKYYNDFSLLIKGNK
jgi:hypothetical protein